MRSAARGAALDRNSPAILRGAAAREVTSRTIANRSLWLHGSDAVE